MGEEFGFSGHVFSHWILRSLLLTKVNDNGTSETNAER